MDGRIPTVLIGLVAPFVALGVTVVYFATNPLAVLGSFTAIIAGSLYLLSYTDGF